MFPFFQRKPAAKPSDNIARHLDESIQSAMFISMDVLEERLGHTLEFTRKARQELNLDQFDRFVGFLAIAQEDARAVAALMESISILHDAGLTGE